MAVGSDRGFNDGGGAGNDGVLALRFFLPNVFAHRGINPQNGCFDVVSFVYMIPGFAV
jgi:hypothetical protein